MGSSVVEVVMAGSMSGLLWFLFLCSSDAATVKDPSKKAKYSCGAVGGLSPNKACIFPFKNPYNGAEHHACTHDHGLPAWCATRVNNDGTMSGMGYIGFCDSECEVEEYATCYASQSSTSSAALGKFSRLKTCVFPFTYKGKEHTEWAPYNRGSDSYPENSNTPFCATAVYANGTHEDWGYCLPDCPGAGPATLNIKAVGQRKSRGHRCVFPFKYKDKWHVECPERSATDRRKWCATELKENGKYEEDQWAYCEGEDSTECKTVGGAKWGVACRFPFKSPWSNKMHWNCTTDSLPESEGSSVKYPNAPWCATNTNSGDLMGKDDWGYCSKECPKEKGNFCYADTGTSLSGLKKCILPFILNGQKYDRCTEYLGKMKCATKVNADGIVAAVDMHECANPRECSEKKTVNGNTVSVGFVDVASYTNEGSSCMEIEFQYSTGFEDSTNKNWNVEASVSAEFSFFVSAGASVTAGGGGESASSSSSEVSHSLSYSVSPYSRVTLRQMVAQAGTIKAHSFKIQLDELSLKTQKELKEIIDGRKDVNGTTIAGLIPCNEDEDEDDDEDEDEGGDDGGDDDGGGGDDDECSNEKYGESEEEEDDEAPSPSGGKFMNAAKKKRKKRNEHCSTKSQEEADKEKEKEEEEAWEKKKAENDEITNEEDCVNGIWKDNVCTTKTRKEEKAEAKEKQKEENDKITSKKDCKKGVWKNNKCNTPESEESEEEETKEKESKESRESTTSRTTKKGKRRGS